jgi:glycosyltransferase involved in cell wall biosynthesis
MHIAVVAPEFPPAFGGMEIYAYEVVRQLASRGYQVTVFTRPHQQGETRLAGVRILPILSANMRQDWQALHPFKDDFDLWHVMNAAYAWIALRVEPVVLSVYGNDFINPNPVATLELKKRLRLPKGDRLDLALAKWRTRQLLDKALHRVHHVITISNFSRDLFLQCFEHCRDKTTVAYLGVSDEFFEVERPPRPKAGATQFTTVCRLSEPRKSVDKVLRAMAKLKDQHDFHYHVVGGGPLLESLKKLSETLGLSGRVTFHGFVESDALKERLATSDLFILTSALKPDTVEGFGIVYLEANACGTPTLAARLGGAAEAVEPGVSGMFVDSPDENEIAAQLEKFLRGEITFSADQCRAFANRFRWNRVVDQMLEHYPIHQKAVQA